MYRRQALHRLPLDNHAPVDHEIHSIAAFKLHLFVDDGRRLFETSTAAPMIAPVIALSSTMG